MYALLVTGAYNNWEVDGEQGVCVVILESERKRVEEESLLVTAAFNPPAGGKMMC